MDESDMSLAGTAWRRCIAAGDFPRRQKTTILVSRSQAMQCTCRQPYPFPHQLSAH
jgi:hypothetical protein